MADPGQYERLRAAHFETSRQLAFIRAQMEAIATTTNEPAVLAITQRALADGEADRWAADQRRRLAAKLDAMASEGASGGC